MHLVWFAVVDTRMSYALPTIYADERDRQRRRLGEKIIGEYPDRSAAEEAIEAAVVALRKTGS